MSEGSKVCLPSQMSQMYSAQIWSSMFIDLDLYKLFKLGAVKVQLVDHW